MKKYFFTGLITLLPIAITAIIIFFLLDILTAPFVGFVEDFFRALGDRAPRFVHHEKMLLFISRIIVLVLLFFTIFLFGVIGRHFFMGIITKKINKLLSKIPFIKTIYRVSQDVATNFFAEGKKYFQGSVIIPFPHKDSNALALLSGDAPKEIRTRMGEGFKSVFVPTAPHPISGFLLMLSDDQIKPVDITTEDMIKLLVSCGIYEPNQTNETTK